MNKLAIIIFSVLLSGCVADTVTSAATGGTWLNHDRRTAGVIIDDQAISVKANLALAKNKELWQSSHISALTYNGSLLLVGQTTCPAYKEQIQQLMEPIEGIQVIYNQITIQKPIPLKERSCDTWITAQVKAKLIANRDVGINRVKVITEDGTVYLMGKLTRDEQQIASNIVRRVSGVKKVVTVFKGLDEGL